MGIFDRAVRTWTADAAAEIGGFAQHPRISLKNTRFTLIDGGKLRTAWDPNNLPVVFVAANPHKSKIYYPGGFDADNPQPPLCYSDNGVAPSSNAQDPQARSCAECRHNVFGTAQDGEGRGKACADRKKLACFVIGDSSLGMLYELSIPPNSLSNWKTYCDLIQSYIVPGGGRQAELFDVVTEVSFDLTNTKNSKLKFRAGAWVSQVGYDQSGRFFKVFEDDENEFSAPDGGEAIAAFIDDVWAKQTFQTDQIVGLNDKPYVAALPPPAAAPAPTPVPAAVSDPAPERRPYQGPPGVAPASPVRAFAPTDGKPVPMPAPEQPKRGGARPGAGRPRKAETAEPAAPQQANPRSIVGRPAPFPTEANGPMERHGIVGQAPAPNKEIEEALRAAINLATE